MSPRKIFRSLALFFAFCAPFANAATTPEVSDNIPHLKDLASPRFFGTALNTSFLFLDANYTVRARTQYSIFTPENEMKWEEIEPEPNVFSFAAPDEIVKFAKSIGARVRGHNFMWGNQLPPWVNTSLTATELDKALKNHIDTIMTHYKGQLYAWDVVNELISDDPTMTFKDNIWTQKFGEDAMPRALTYARAVDKTPKLYVNDYGTEAINNKSDTLYSVVQGFIKDGVPIDAIGFQCHFFVGGVPSTLQQNLQRFADLGLDVAITELDINITGAKNASAFEQQAKDYWSVVDACVKTGRCVSVTTWGISDDHSWIPTGAVLPFDAEKEPKPAFWAAVDAFTGKSSP